MVIRRQYFIPVLKTGLLSQGGGGGGGSGYQHIAPAYSNVTCTGKGVKIYQPISGPELTVMMILLVDWRC